MSIKERIQVIKTNNLCFNCLLKHKLKQCRSRPCHCNLYHHSSIHYPREQKTSRDESQGNNLTVSDELQFKNSNFNLNAPTFQMPSQIINSDHNLTSTTCSLASETSSVLLSTFVCLIRDAYGNYYPVRGLLDVGATSNFVSKRLVDKLNLKREKINLSVSGLNEMSLNIRNKVSAVISNRERNVEFKLDFLVVPRILDSTPTKVLELNKSSLVNIKLADEKFNIPCSIDLLLGAEKFYELLRPGQIYPPNTKIMLQNSIFGFIVSGSLPSKSKDSVYCGLITNNYELEKAVRDFWEIEDIERDTEIPKNREAQICETHYVNNYSRDETGRYIVKMPLREEPSCLGESKQRAIKCLNALWNRFNREPDLYNLYKSFMEDYLSLEHMEEVQESREPDINYYIPHHGVLRTESTTTPLRVVFNASAVTSNGNSLNGLQYNGGVIQEDLFSVMLRFRKYLYAFVADIKMMYRKILIHPSQKDLLRIVWKSHEEDEIKTYRLCTVTYGTTSAPHLATRTLKQLATDEGNDFPLAASVLVSDCYMDDILSGADNLNTAKELQEQLISLLSRAGMQLHKWSANHLSLLGNNTNSSDYSFSNEAKTLGLIWRPQVDCFGFKVITEQRKVYTKRSVLSQIARIFDPLGLIGPIITTAKVFLQKLWLLKIDWNDYLPHKENSEWSKFVESLKIINLISIPRCILIDQPSAVELHGFSDASEVAYAAVIYVKSKNPSGECAVKLLTSKSRVSPLKRITIPRLELSAAVLLVKLMKKVSIALKLDVSATHYWTDSTIVLSWLKKEPSELKTFVSNRVSIIQGLTTVDQWHHVSSKTNPADHVSRGIDPLKIQQCDLWWFGPPFLLQCERPECSETTSSEKSDLFLRELKTSSNNEFCALVNTVEPIDIINNCSSFSKIQRIVAWCRRFVHNSRNPLYPVTGTLTSSELSDSLMCIVKNIQQTSYVKEITCLERGIPLPTNSKLLNLCPFLDNSGILRVGGRLKNAYLSINQKHPMIIPPKHPFTCVLINYFHNLYCHSGAELTLSLIRQQFWIPAARNIIRKVLYNCLKCKRVSAKSSQQFMADLPTARVTVSRIFSHTGLDYCGPFQIKYFVGRSKQVRKIYICVFVCFSTKALHFEIVHDMTTAAFLGAFKRFIARRGKPSQVFSDNGRNFVGANNELKSILKCLFKSKGKEELENYLASEGIKWHFNPPSAPHFGGLWEASVKSLKYHLKRVIGNTILSYEEFLTLVTQVEAVLNSRPLCPLSNDPNDVEALTPAHFIIGSSLLALPEPDYTEIPRNRLSRWQLVQKLTQHLWKKWSSEYLNKLTQRPKWYKGKVEIKEGDLVLIKNSENTGYLKWHLARVIQIHPGKDHIIRVVTLKDKNGIFKKPLTKVALLPSIN